MEIWVAKDKYGTVAMFDHEPEFDDSGRVGDCSCFILAEKMGSALGAGQKAKVISYDFKTGKSEIEICRDPVKSLVDQVEGFLSGKVSKAALARSLKAVKSQAK